MKCDPSWLKNVDFGYIIIQCILRPECCSNILELIGEFSCEPFGTFWHHVGLLFSGLQNWCIVDYLIVRGFRRALISQ